VVNWSGVLLDAVRSVAFRKQKTRGFENRGLERKRNEAEVQQ
jgi:hypothetical protein